MFTKNLNAVVCGVCVLWGVGSAVQAQDSPEAKYVEMVIDAVVQAANAVRVEAMPFGKELEQECELKVINPSKTIKILKEEAKKTNKPSAWRKLGNMQLFSGLECDAIKSFEKAGDLDGVAKAKAKCQ